MQKAGQMTIGKTHPRLVSGTFYILPGNILVVVDYHIPNPFRLLLNWDQSMLELQLCQIDKFLINTK